MELMAISMVSTNIRDEEGWTYVLSYGLFVFIWLPET